VGVVCAAVVAMVACGSSSDGSKVGTGGSGNVGQAGTLMLIIGNGGDGSSTGGAGVGTGGSDPGPYMLPAGFTPETKGGYKLGDPISDGAGGGAGSSAGGSAGAAPGGCGTQILGVVRDFKGINEMGGHPDFEHYAGTDASIGIVMNDLGTDQKPVYATAGGGPFIDTAVNGDANNGQQTTSKADFDQWYRATPGVNKPYIVYLYFEPNNGVLTFESEAFFPLDNAGWGNTCAMEDTKKCPKQPHNFGFTTEVHTRFNYKGGETFAFTGDDDLWVFINNKLAIDLGGLHQSTSKTVSLDAAAKALGITVGSAYNLDLFHAERHTSASNFRVDTNLEFTNCGTVIPDNPPK